MPGPARIKGTKLTLDLAGTIQLNLQTTNVLMDNEEASGGVTTFADADEGGARQHFLTVTGVQSTEQDSFWRYAWANPGLEVAFRYRPHGNAVATAAQPHFTGTLVLGPRPALGGEAGRQNEFTFDYRMDIVGVPTMDSGTSAAPILSAVSSTTPAKNSVIQVTGSRFGAPGPVTAVRLAAVSVGFTIINDTTMAVLIPAAQASGAVALTAVSAGGTSNAINLTIP